MQYQMAKNRFQSRNRFLYRGQNNAILDSKKWILVSKLETQEEMALKFQEGQTQTKKKNYLNLNEGGSILDTSKKLLPWAF